MMKMMMTALPVCFSFMCICRLLCKPINAEVTRHSGPALHTVTADVSVGLFELIEAVFDQRHSTASLYGFHLPIENVLPEYTEVGLFCCCTFISWIATVLFVQHTHTHAHT